MICCQVVEAPAKKDEDQIDVTDSKSAINAKNQSSIEQPPLIEEGIAHERALMVDTTACPLDIRYPANLNSLNNARQNQKS